MKFSYLVLVLMLFFFILPVNAEIPLSYINPYAYQIPWIQQGVPPLNEQPICAATMSVYTLELLRYKRNNITPSFIQEPYTRNVWKNTSWYNLTIDEMPEYALSPASIYWYWRSSGVMTSKRLAIVQMGGVNYENDWITPKNLNKYYPYPKTATYLKAHRIEGTAGYYWIIGNTSSQWEQIKQAVYQNGVVNIEVYTYANLHKSVYGLDGGPQGINFPEPVGNPVSSHSLAVVGYETDPDRLIVLNSWGETMWGYNWPKLGGLTRSYFEKAHYQAWIPQG